MRIAPADAVAGLVGILDVEALGGGAFRGVSAVDDGSSRLFGGQIVAQALVAAARTTGDDRLPHSLHAYFLRAGDPRRPVIFQVAADLDGRSFANRRVIATQDDAPILTLSASFHRPEDGLAHGAAMPDVPPPERAIDLATATAQADAAMPDMLMARLASFDIRVAALRAGEAGAGAGQSYWFRLAAPAPEAMALRHGLLAYASDFALSTTAVLPHGIDFFSPRLQAASLDHAIWFHQPPILDDWLLYTMDTPWSGRARGYSRGLIFDRGGRLIASVAQEALIRLRAGD